MPRALNRGSEGNADGEKRGDWEKGARSKMNQEIAQKKVLNLEEEYAGSHDLNRSSYELWIVCHDFLYPFCGRFGLQGEGGREKGE
jgi:hypothetical protein